MQPINRKKSVSLHASAEFYMLCDPHDWMLFRMQPGFEPEF